MAAGFPVPRESGAGLPLSRYCCVPKGFTAVDHQSKLSTALVLPDLKNKSVGNLIHSVLIHIHSTSPEQHVMRQ